MAAALVRAFRSYTAKYCPPRLRLDDLYADFFDRNLPIFEAVKREFLNAAVRSRPFPVEPGMIRAMLEMGDRIIGAGLDVGNIFQWRAAAWEEARERLGG
jgi:hypothetical protein